MVSVMDRHSRRDYRQPEWRTFRAEMLEREGFRCARCGRTQAAGVVLQVHHKRYVTGRKPWQYGYEECEVLCRGCHGESHGLVRPSIGWECFGDEDLGDLCGNCELCGTELRYLFFVSHPHWEPMEVGTNCCDNLTGTGYASSKVESIVRYRQREARFVDSVRWQIVRGVPTIKQKQVTIEIVLGRSEFRLRLNGVEGKKSHPTLEAAKVAAFEFIESGNADKFFRTRR